MALGAYNIFGQHNKKNYVYLFLDPSKHKNLITWDEREQGNHKKIVAYLESGYPGFVPLSFIEEALIIKSFIYTK